MHHRIRFIACGALVAGTALAVALPGGVAGAKSVKGICSTLSGNATTLNLQNCTAGAQTGGSGVSTTTSEMISGNTVTGTDSVQWNIPGSTSTESFTGTLFSGKKDKCTPPVGYSNLDEVKEKGSVTGGTGAATALTGGKTKGTVCVFQSGSTILVENFPGTTLAF